MEPVSRNQPPQSSFTGTLRPSTTSENLKDTVKETQQKSDVLKCLKIDLINDADQLAGAQLLIANLLIEYIGYDPFQRVVCKVNPEYE